VTIQHGAEIINSTVRGPTIIGEHTRVVNSYIGPYTSIGHHVTVENSEIEHSMILESSRISDIETRIQDSLIGRDVVVSRSPIRPKALKLTVGDHSKIGIL
jgi:glucose-1-phosphate thymidylyltransferase